MAADLHTGQLLCPCLPNRWAFSLFDFQRIHVAKSLSEVTIEYIGIARTRASSVDAIAAEERVQHAVSVICSQRRRLTQLYFTASLARVTADAYPDRFGAVYVLE